ncbi:MAG: TIGR01906 family membrane protein [Lachnospirales bacterium]
MIKKFTLSFILGISIIFITLYCSVYFWANNDNFFSKKFIENDSTSVIGISTEDLFNVNERLIDYMFDRYDTMNIIAPSYSDDYFFTEKEEHHMVDVKNLFTMGFYLFTGSIITALAIILYSLHKKNAKIIFNLSSKVILCILLLCTILGIIISFDFNKYFTIFHEIFFTNDLWLLDPTVDMMINMYPLNFFIDMSFNIILTFGILNLIYIGSSLFITRRKQ